LPSLWSLDGFGKVVSNTPTFCSDKNLIM
jgi:hypothetical protein